MKPHELEKLVKFLGYKKIIKEYPHDNYIKRILGKKKSIEIYLNKFNYEISVDFLNDYNALMDLVDGIESLGYTVYITNFEIVIKRDFKYQHSAPNVYVKIDIDRRDYPKKQVLFDACWIFIKEYEKADKRGNFI